MKSGLFCHYTARHTRERRAAKRRVATRASASYGVVWVGRTTTNVVVGGPLRTTPRHASLATPTPSPD